MQYKEILQQLADTSSNMFNLDIEIIDNHLFRVAGTGVLKAMNGQEVTKNGMVANIIHNTKVKRLIVEHPGYEPICINCSSFGKCPYKVAVYSSIFYQGEILGVIGLVYFGFDEHDPMEHTSAELLSFVEEMSDLICLRIQEKEQDKHLRSSEMVFGAIMDGLDRGIIIINAHGVVTYLNAFVAKRFGLNNALGKGLEELVPGIELNQDNTGEYRALRVNDANYLYNVREHMLADGQSQRVVNILSSKKDSGASDKAQHSIDNIIGSSSLFLSFKEKVKKIAHVESTVLLTGESGTGKELFARAIHNLSQRAKAPYVVINCSTIPETLIESTLFGYEKGAFTGAIHTGKEGKFMAANNGTVFLDEIEAIPLHVQPKLLRVLENRMVEQVGGVKEIPVNIRIIAATNVDLKELVDKGLFRFDLFQRLNVVPLRIPPLRERGRDVLVLAQHFLDIYKNRFNKDIIALDEEVSQLFLSYKWPGNVRELKNTMEFAVLVETSQYITRESLNEQYHQSHKKHQTFMTLAELERDYIKKALDYFGWHEEGRMMAAKQLGISRSTIYRKIKEHAITQNVSK